MFAPRPTVVAWSPRLTGPNGAALGLPAGVAVALVTWFLGGHAGVGLVLAALAVILGTALVAHLVARVITVGPARSPVRGYPGVRIVGARAGTVARGA